MKHLMGLAMLLAAGAVTVPVAVAVAAAGTTPRDSASSSTTPAAPAPAPLRVTQTSLRQSGQQLVWRVQLASRFSAAGLSHDHRTLCLVLERARGGSVSGVACVQPRRNGHRTRLMYMRVTAAGRGRAQPVAAQIRRTSTRALTARFVPGQVGLGYRPMRWQVLSTQQATACASAASPSPGCQLWYPVHPQLLRVHVPVPVGCVPSGPSFVTNGSRARHVVALTFDDGPWPDTPQFLALLEREHVPATFFQIGEQVPTYGRGVDRRILAAGDIIGDHTWNHADVAGGGSFAAGEIARARAAIAHESGFTPCLFRAPGGAVSPGLISEARSMGFITIQWDVDPRDWSRPGTGTIISTVLSQVRNGSIVLQHDGGGDRSETLAALPTEIRVLRRRGYRFVTIPELLGLRVIYK